VNDEIKTLALLTGKAKLLARGELSAISKYANEGIVKIDYLGIEGDQQADLSVHGGPEKALHHYPFDHYSRWATHAPDADLLNALGAFGENISTRGLCEQGVCIGDRFRLGSALLEISQGRQPCWKQGARLAWNALPALMVKERRSGWYYRVIEQGTAQSGDMLTLIDRPLPDWSVARVFGLLIAGDHKTDPAALRALMAMEVLFEGWRARASELCKYSVDEISKNDHRD
jgi:MOSC domain-containing protein YiiM